MVRRSSERLCWGGGELLRARLLRACLRAAVGRGLVWVRGRRRSCAAVSPGEEFLISILISISIKELYPQPCTSRFYLVADPCRALALQSRSVGRCSSALTMSRYLPYVTAAARQKRHLHVSEKTVGRSAACYMLHVT